MTDNDDFIDYDEDDCYDRDGNISPGGLYDAGGHIIPERWACYVDHLMDRLKDEK